MTKITKAKLLNAILSPFWLMLSEYSFMGLLFLERLSVFRLLCGALLQAVRLHHVQN